MRRHLLILLVITILVRGWLMISYPLNVADDNQAGQMYLIDELLQGNLLIGNLRYQTGYPFIIAPVAAVAQHFGQFDDRIVLLVQIALSAAIPFLVYDLLCQPHIPQTQAAERKAFVVALFVLLDPFGLQWAHYWLPEWWIAFCMILGVWLVEQGLRRNHPFTWTAAAGIILGIAALARLNFAPIIALLGLLLLLRHTLTWRQRLRMFVTLGATSLSALVLYLVLIQVPSTGTSEWSCISGINMIEGANDKGIFVRAENGAASAEYLDLHTRQSDHEILFLSDTYPRWQQPGPWATTAELEAFHNNSITDGYPMSDTNLIYFLGACPADDLMHRVFFETVRAEPLLYLAGTLSVAGEIILQLPTADSPHYLATPTDLTPASPASAEVLGFRRMTGHGYTGEWLWMPGVSLFSALFPFWNLVKWLTPIALVWALFNRNWFYGAFALFLIAGALLTAAVEAPEARIYSWMYPLAPILIGGLVATLLEKLRRIRPAPAP